MTQDASFSYWVPIAPDDVRAIAELLRARAAFSPSFLAPKVDRYDAAVYLHQSAQFGTRTVLISDRNVLSRIVDLVRGTEATEEHRLAAGILTFAQCARIDIERNIALYELARTQGHDAAVSELAEFRIADHLHPGYLAEIALGQARRLELSSSEARDELPDSKIDFSMSLRRWRRNYVLRLKIAALELQGGDAARRMLDLVKWMYEDFLLSGPGLMLAAHYLAPNARRKRLLKGLRSADREKAIAGIRNAAWDLTLLSEWAARAESQEEDGCLTLLASLDRGIHRLARSVVGADEAADSLIQRLRSLFVSLWGESSGSRLAKQVYEAYMSMDNGSRKIHQAVENDYVGTCIEDGEAEIRDWNSKS